MKPSPNPRRPARRPPSWLLPSVVGVSLLAAGALFVADRSGDDPAGSKPAASTATSTTPRGELVAPTLVVPDDADTSTNGAGRRDPLGRSRVPEDALPAAPSDGPEDQPTDSQAPPALPPIAANLAGERIGLAPASASTSSGADARLVRLGALRVPCAAAQDAERLAVELAVLDRIEQLLERSGAVVVRIDDAAHLVPCVDVRVKRLELARRSVIVRADPSGAGRAIAARSDAGGSAAARAGSITLARDLARAAQLDGITAASSPPIRTLLASVGAIDRAGGGDVAVLELGLGRTATAAQLDSAALAVVTGLAVHATRVSAR